MNIKGHGKSSQQACRHSLQIIFSRLVVRVLMSLISTFFLGTNSCAVCAACNWNCCQSDCRHFNRSVSTSKSPDFSHAFSSRYESGQVTRGKVFFCSTLCACSTNSLKKFPVISLLESGTVRHSMLYFINYCESVTTDH